MNEGTGGGTGFNIDIVNSFLTKAQDTLESFWTENEEVLLYILGIVVVISLLMLAAKLWKRGTSKA